MTQDVSARISSRIAQVEQKVLGKKIAAHPDLNLKKVRMLARELEEQSQREKAYEREIEKLKNLQRAQEREYASLNEELHEQIDKKESILSEYRSTLKEQRKIIEKKQEEVNILQIRVNDLKYELNNVLKIKDVGEEEKEAILESELSEDLEERSGLMDTIQDKLDRYVKMAVKLSGAHHLNQDVRYTGLTLGSLIIDQRRLYDRLQNEEQETLLVFSREENRLVFVNNHVKELLGWSPERFLKDFSLLIQKGHTQWDDALEDVKLDHQKSIRLLMKTRTGEDQLTHCILKEVPDGVFKGYVLGILSLAAPVKERDY